VCGFSKTPDSKLNFKTHVINTVNKANIIQALIQRNATSIYIHIKMFFVPSHIYSRTGQALQL